jgi:aldose 1-epimerase
MLVKMKIEKQMFGTIPGRGDVHLYTLKSNRGMEVEVINYGAIITAIRVPDRAHEPGDVVLGFDTLEPYLGNHPYFGAMVGRFCNRIGNSRFELGGTIYSLTANEGDNHLHGGKRGFDKQLWTASSHRSPDQVSLTLAYRSPDGEEGYPGSLVVETEYSLNDQNELGIRCRARTDRPTHVNLTNHSYFNLNGCRGTIYDHELFIDSGSVTELDGESIPTGRILKVENTPYDFRLSRPIGTSIGKVAPGYDINYVLDMKPGELSRVAALFDPHSGRTMEVLTTLPGLQLYTSNHINGISGKAGLLYGKHCAVCLETQYFPDTPNQASFPSTLLRPGDLFDEVTVYRFSQ